LWLQEELRRIRMRIGVVATKRHEKHEEEDRGCAWQHEEIRRMRRLGVVATKRAEEDEA